MKQGEAHGEQIGAEAWIFHALFQELQKTKPDA